MVKPNQRSSRVLQFEEVLAFCSKGTSLTMTLGVVERLCAMLSLAESD